jgi:hypothetical protein
MCTRFSGICFADEVEPALVEDVFMCKQAYALSMALIR